MGEAIDLGPAPDPVPEIEVMIRIWLRLKEPNVVGLVQDHSGEMR